MKRLLTTILVLALAFGLAAGCWSPSPAGTVEQAPKTGREAPDFRLPNLEGQSVSLRDFRGKPVLVNFWATWCEACKVEMPYLQEVHEKWSGEGLVILAIDLGESRSRVERFMQMNKLTFTALLDTNQSVAERYNVIGLPTTFLIDENGIIQAVKVGAFTGVEEIEKYLGKIMP